MEFNKKNENGFIRKEVLPLRVPNKIDLMYGVEQWEWEEKIEVVKTQGEYIKLIMGIDRNTPGYIWRGETGRSNLYVY